MLSFASTTKGGALAYVPTEVLKSVVFLGYINGEGKERFAGSAFWISRPVPADSKDPRQEYLVTAAHVIEDMKKDMGNNRVRIRVNLIEGNQQWEDTPLQCWKFHPDHPKVDLAALQIGIDSTWDHVAWPGEYFASKDSIDNDLSDRKLELGDELFFAGLFWLHKGQNRNIPIVRIGNIAALREEPVLSPGAPPMDAYLVESRSIGGLSGSPVFIDIMTAKSTLQPKSGCMAAAHWEPSPSRFRLVGVVHGHFDW